MALIEDFVEILSKPPSGAVFAEMCMFLGPVWIAFLLGVMFGWSWKPRWASLGYCNFHLSAPSSPSASVSPPLKTNVFVSTQNFDCFKVDPSFDSSIMDKGSGKDQIFTHHPMENPNCSSSHTKEEEGLAVTEEDFDHLCHLVERNDGGPAWRHMMDRSAPSMSYQAWIREPGTGPPQYCSTTVYEDATPEMLRDFFWDDEFRLKWDDMILHAATMEECPTTGTMIVHWIRKFPFFCSDREYTIGRRIWESGRVYYCVTKGVPCPSVPRQQKPRRVDLYYSSWSIRAVESRKGNGQLSACEVTLFHHEDMGIPWEIAKLGVRQGMWSAVKNIERGFRVYQKERASGSPISRPAFMAQINTKIDPDHLKSFESDETLQETEVASSSAKPTGTNIPKLLVFGGAVALVCTLDRGLLTKAVIFSVAKRFANIGRRAYSTPQI